MHRMRSALEKLSSSTRWSKLKKFANSNPARLTVLAPLVGYLILFNAEIRKFLEIVFPIGVSEASANWLQENNLTFLYFGLVFYGLAVGVFSLFCPTMIKENESVTAHVLSKEQVKTPNLVRRHFRETIRKFFQHNSDERRSRFFGDLSFSFPYDAAEPLHLLVDHVADDGLSGFDNLSEFQTGSGEFQTDVLMEIMLSERRVERVFSSSLYHASLSLSKEVFYVSYRAFDYDKFGLRCTCSILFLLGFLFLIIPTLVTCWLILSGLYS